MDTAAAEHAHMYPVVRMRLEQQEIIAIEESSSSSSLKSSRKRAVELEELDDYVAMETTGAYEVAVMPKRFKFPGALDGEDCRCTGVYVRGMLLVDAMKTEIEAKAAARARR
uniref:Uncharacterized protein n=1 Tax=Oryza rufipogon TaxID=4529 RepID=A0A0E0QID4_ORYRU